MKIKVSHFDGNLEDFHPKKIRKQLQKETQLSEEDIEKITETVIRRIKKHELSEVHTSTIRAIITSQMLERGFLSEIPKVEKMGMSMEAYEELNNNGRKDNANIQYSHELVNKYASDSIAKDYALRTMPKNCSDAHKQGYVHHHDLEFYNSRPNCFNMDARFIARNGLQIDGKGDVGSVTNPPKSLEVFTNQLLQGMMACATVFSGGIGLANFNTFLSPFAKGRTYAEIKQCMQMFWYNANCSLVCRGGQVLFSSVGLDLSIPSVLADEEAVSFGGVPIGRYKDYQEEADLIFRACCEVIEEGDAESNYHRFPNVLFNIRENDIEEYTGNCRLLHELGANNPTIYYVNCTDIERTVMGALTSDTPVMTDKGFKYPYELRIGDNVMTYSDDGSKCWNKIYNIIEKEAPSKVFKFTCDNGYSFKVTDNHKLPTIEGIVKSEDLQVGMELYNYIDELFVPVDDYESEFIGVFLADGFIRHKPRHQKNSNDIEFHIRKEWKANEIIKLCSELNYDYEFIICKDGSFKVIVKEKELRDELVKLYDDNLGVKRFPSQYWNDKNKLANIIKGLMFDGRKGSKTRWVWSCSDKELVYDFCYAISLLGLKSTIYEDVRKGSTGNWKTNYIVSFGKNYNPKNSTKIKSIELVDNSEPVYDLTIENNHNYVCGLGGIHSQNCRTALPMNYLNNYEEDCLNTGNFMYTTINLPLLAIESESESEFYELLDKYCEVVYDTLHHRRAEVEKAMYTNHMHDFLLQKDKLNGKQLYELDRTTFTIGFCGLNECLVALYDEGIDTQADKGVEIVKFINKKKTEFYNRDGWRWSVIASPSESTSGRFANIIKNKHPQAFVQGEKGAYYLTNSTHLPVKKEAQIGETIQNADKFHGLNMTGGGNLCHIWLGEVFSSAEALWRLNQKILRTNTTFWAYSKVFTFCRDCEFTINDMITECPICKSKNLRSYDRITGYYVPIDQYGASKKKEQEERFRVNL